MSIPPVTVPKVVGALLDSGRSEEIVGRLDKSANDREILANMARPSEASGPALGDGRTETKQIVLSETEDRILTPLTSAAVCIMKVSDY